MWPRQPGLPGSGGGVSANAGSAKLLNAPTARQQEINSLTRRMSVSFPSEALSIDDRAVMQTVRPRASGTLPQQIGSFGEASPECGHQISASLPNG
jgi:hypothetical protein